MESSGTWKLVLVFTYLPGTYLILEYGLFKPRSPMGNPTGHALIRWISHTRPYVPGYPD